MQKNKAELLKAFIYALVDAVVCGGPRGIKGIRRFPTRRQLSRVPLFDSFFRDHVNTVDHKTYAKYTKSNAERQEQVLKKVTRKTDTDNVRAKIAKYLGHEFPGFFVKGVICGVCDG